MQPEMLTKTKEALAPLETQNIIGFFQATTLQTILNSPVVLAALVLVLFYAVIKRSKFMLLFLFTLLSIILLVRYTLPAPGTPLEVGNTLPFAFGCLGVGAVLLYFIFIKAE